MASQYSISVDYIGGIAVKGAAEYTRKQLDELTEWVKRPQVGARAGFTTSSMLTAQSSLPIDKFYTPEPGQGNGNRSRR